MDFLISNAYAEWQAAPHVVPKPASRAQFRMIIDLSPFNATNNKRAWPMPHLESEMQDFAGYTCFCTLHVVSEYWQLPLDPNAYGKIWKTHCMSLVAQ